MYEPQEIRAELLHGEEFRHFLVPYERIYLIPSMPGLYVWNIYPQTQADYQFVGEFFAQLKLRAEISGHLRLRYVGDLSKQYDLPKEAPDMDLLKDVMLCVPYAIYIGISTNLNARINAHKDAFESSLSGRNYDALKELKEDNEEPTVDTIAESKNFGQRLAKIWPRGLNKTNLYLRYVVPKWCEVRRCDKAKCTSTCRDKTKLELRRCEDLANSLFNPVFGRR